MDAAHSTTAFDHLAEWADREIRRRDAALLDAVLRVYVEGGILRVTDEGVEVIDPRDFYNPPPEPL